MGDLKLPWYAEVDGERERICKIIMSGGKAPSLFILEITNVHGTKQYYHKKLLRVGSIEQADKLSKAEADKAIQKIIESRAKVKTNLIEC
jgi:hypothetical protein